MPIIHHGLNVNGMVDSDMFNTDRKNVMFAVRNAIAHQIWELQGEEDANNDDEAEQNEIMDNMEEDD
ncbi:hypothetical protein M5689_018838 [Euphorbia peplus]|nr:hypothetical protein M5689_018838 [Euphorbia peplus]